MAKRMKQRSSGPEDKSLGEKIRGRRLLAGLSQAELGERLGVSFQQVQKYEKGVNRVTAGRLQQIAEACGESVGYFMPSANKTISKAGEEMQTLMADPVNLRMLRALSAIKDQALRFDLVRLVEKTAARDE